RVRMWIDETGRYDQACGIDRAGGSQVCFARFADEDDAISANANVRQTRFFTRAINKFTVKNQQIEMLLRPINPERAPRCRRNQNQRAKQRSCNTNEETNREWKSALGDWHREIIDLRYRLPQIG